MEFIRACEGVDCGEFKLKTKASYAQEDIDIKHKLYEHSREKK